MFFFPLRSELSVWMCQICQETRGCTNVAAHTLEIVGDASLLNKHACPTVRTHVKMLRCPHCWICTTSNAGLQKSRLKTSSPNCCSRLPRGAPCIITSPRRELALSTYRKASYGRLCARSFVLPWEAAQRREYGFWSDGDRGVCAKTKV